MHCCAWPISQDHILRASHYFSSPTVIVENWKIKFRQFLGGLVGLLMVLCTMCYYYVLIIPLQMLLCLYIFALKGKNLVQLKLCCLSWQGVGVRELGG